MGATRNRYVDTGIIAAFFAAQLMAAFTFPGLAWAEPVIIDNESVLAGELAGALSDDLQNGDAENPEFDGDDALSQKKQPNANAETDGEYFENVEGAEGFEEQLLKGDQIIDPDEQMEQPTLTDSAVTADSNVKPEPASQAAAPAKPVLTAQAATSAKSSMSAGAEKRGAIKDGVYVIASAKSLSCVLDVSGASKQNGANVLLWNDNGQTNQQWRIAFDKNTGRYSIVSVNSNMALVFSSAKSGANVFQKKLSGSAAFLWSIMNTSSGYVLAPAGSSGIALDVQGGAGNNGDNIELWVANDKPWQRFWFVDVNPQLDAKSAILDGVYTISRADSKNQMVDVEGASRDNAANVLLYHNNGGFNQRWYVSRDKNNLFTITSINSGKSLDICNAAHTPGSNVIQYATHGNANQKWQIRDNGNGTYSIISKLNGLALNAAGTGDCANIYMFVDNGAASERFVFTKSKLVGDGVYSISPRQNLNEVVDVPSLNKANGVQVALWTYNKGMNQKYQLVDRGNEIYTIQAAHSGSFLEDAGGKVVQKPKTSGNAQLWKASWTGTGVMLTNQATRRSITVSGSIRNGALLTVTVSSGSAAQRFSFTSRSLVENGLYTMQSGTGACVLDVNAASKAESANLQLWAANDGNNQKFTLEAVSDGYYKIINLNSGKAATATNAVPGANVCQSNYNGAASQLWKAEIGSNGGVVFVGKQSGRALSVAGNASSNGANVQIDTNSGTSGQTWYLVATRPHDIVLDRAFAQANAYGSGTGYFIAVDLANHRAIVLRRSGNSWTEALNVIVSTGAPNTPTVTGTFTIGSRGYSFGSGYTCYYWTQFYGDYLFHSVLYNQGTRNIQDGRLGYSISHGCVRMSIDDAYWIYSNVPYGSRVRVY